MTTRDEHILEILGSVHTNDKICTQADYIDVYKPSMMRGVYRWWNGEQRSKNITVVETVVDSTITKIKLMQVSQPRDSETLDRLIRLLTRSEQGMTHLAETYREDASTCARLRLLVESIKTFLASQNHCSEIVIHEA